MGARGTGAPACTRGRPCRKCGADEWRQTGKKWQCIPCDRRRAKAWNKAKWKRAPWWGLWRNAKLRAQQAGIPFTITAEDVKAVWPEDNHCPIFGVELVRGKGTLQDNSPTLDRLNPAWGYEPGNIAVISFAANRAKSNMRASDLEKIAAWMRRNGLD